MFDANTSYNNIQDIIILTITQTNRYEDYF